MKKDMFMLTIDEFVSLDPEQKIDETREIGEYLFDYESWKTTLYSKEKIKFILQYLQGIFKWLQSILDLKDYMLSISSIMIDKYIFSLYQNEEHIFNCCLNISFFSSNNEENWEESIVEHHFSNNALENGIPVDALTINYWKGEEGFEKFINMLMMTIRDRAKFDNLPVQWTIDFKDKKLNISRTRMQLNVLQSQGKARAEELERVNDENAKTIEINDADIDISKRPFASSEKQS